MDNSPPLAGSGNPHRAWRLLLLGLVCLSAFWLRSAGIDWPTFHPDEHPVGEWIKQTAARGYVAEKVYPGGFFALTRPVQFLGRVLRNGLHACAYHQGATDLPMTDYFDPIRFARWFNVWLGMLTCVFMYGLVRRITGSGGAGVLAAALFAGAQYPVEHSHYGETDIAMVFMLSIACWLWAAALDRRQPFAFCAAALLSGFTAGTKFTLILLAALPLVMVLAWPGRRGSAPRLAGPIYAGLGLGLFLVGLALANPLLVMDWRGFWAGLAWESRRVYAETALNLGIMSNHPAIRYALHLRALGQCALTLGWGWIILALIGIPCALLKPYRRFWPILLLFPTLYTAYWIFFAPWVRTQEFLNYLPALAALATLPLTLLWRARRPWLRITAALMAGAALTLNAGNGWRVAELFGWTDTRLLARQWQEQRLPNTARLAVENYAEPAFPAIPNPPVLLYKIEREGLAYAKGRGADFLLRTATISGRGLLNPATGRRYPSAQKLFDEFQAQSERLAAWGPRSPLNLATFISPTIELWSLRSSPPPRRRLTLELPQPLQVHDVYASARLRPTFFPVGHKLGGATGLLIDRRLRTAAIGDPPERRQPVYLVLNTEERAAAIRIRGRGRRQTVELDPYSAAIVPLRCSSWPGYAQPFERLALEAALTQEDIIYLPCYARLAYSPDEAARICADLGRPEAFWTAFKPDDLAQGDSLQRYLLAVNGGRWDLADRWEPAAARTGAALAALIQSDPADLAINGNSGSAYDALARVRLLDYEPSQATPADYSWAPTLDADTRHLARLELTAEHQPTNAPLHGEMILPLRVARGAYELRGMVFVKPDPARQTFPLLIEYAINQRDARTERYASNAPAGWNSFAMRFSAQNEIQPRLTVRSSTPMQLFFKDLELRWSLASALEAVSRSLAAARAAHDLRRNRPAEALALLDGLETDPGRPDALEIRQLRFQARRALEKRASARLAESAREALELAPDTYACLEALADTDPAAGMRAEKLRANLKPPLAAGPFLELVGGTFDPARRELVCVFEILKNETPPLAVALHARRHDRWRKHQSAPLSARPRLQRGERVAVRLALNDKFGAAPDPARIALGIESDVQWHPGPLPIAGRREGVIPLSELPAAR